MLTSPDEIVYACENPQVLQRVAESCIDKPMVCFSGNPSSAGQLLAERSRILHHGDLNWRGVAIAGWLFATGAQPWRMSSDDYLRALESGITHIPLTGQPRPTPWSILLRAEKEHAGLAVHEESVLDDLIHDLVPQS
jgi:hypothetical protein